MCEFKQKCDDARVYSAEKNCNLIVATIESGSLVAEKFDPRKNTAYYEAALEATTFGKFNYVMIIVCGLILSNVLLETLGMGFVLPVSQCDLQLSLQERGMLSAIGFAGIISSSHLWGFLADTTGRRNVIRPTLLLGFTVTVLSSFATNFWLLVVLRFVNGFCVSGGSATSYAYLGEFHTSKNRSRAIMGAAFIFGVGAILLPVIAGLVINQDWRIAVPFLGLTYKPWRLLIVVCGLLGLVCGLCLYKLPESPKFLLSQGNEERALKILQDIFHINTGRSRDEYPYCHLLEDLDSPMQPKNVRDPGSYPAVILLRSMWAQTQPLFNRKYMCTTTLICTIQFWIFVTSNGLYMWFPYILNSVAEHMKESPEERIYICQVIYAKQDSMHKLETAMLGGGSSSGVAASIVEECSEKLETSTYEQAILLEVLYAVGFAVIGAIVNKVGKMYILFVCLVVCGACGIAIVFVDIPQLAIYLYVILLLCGLGINVMGAVTVDLYPTRLRAMAICISLMMGRLGSVVGTNVVSALLSDNCESAFIAAGISLIISGFLGFLIPKASQLSGNQLSPRRASLVSMTGN